MDAATRLCTSCGFCCDGTLFTHVLVTDDERARVRLALAPGDEPMEQPCKHLDDKRCSVYEDRPSVCQSFRCRLLVSVDQERVTLEGALAAVARISALRTELAGALPPGEGTVWERVARASTAPREASSAGGLLLAGVFRAMLTRHFLDPFPTE